MANFFENASTAAIVGSISGAGASLLVSWWTQRLARLHLQSDAFMQMLEQLVVNSGAYWRAQGQDKALERQIKADLERLDLRTDTLFRFRRFKRNSQELISLIDDFSTAATGGDFEVATRTRNIGRADKIKSLARQISDLLDPN